MSPYAYPAHQHVRRYGPQGYQDIESFRPWLRDDFSFRCVCCLRREVWDQAVSMEIDHFQPIQHDPELRLDYDNLLYASSRCNAAKGAQQVPDPIAPDIPHGFRATTDCMARSRMVPKCAHRALRAIWC